MCVLSEGSTRLGRCRAISSTDGQPSARAAESAIEVDGLSGLMAKSGRDLERLVHVIERALVRTPLTMQSPEFIVGRRSETRREVDVSIRGQVGPDQVLVMVECRDRSRPATIQWIDEVVAKAQDIGATNVVIVTTGGFSKSAIKYAGNVGIAIRELESLDADGVLEGAPGMESTTFCSRHVEIHRVTSHLVDDGRPIEPIEGEPPAFPTTTPFLRRTKDLGEIVDVDHLWEQPPRPGVRRGAPGEATSDDRDQADQSQLEVPGADSWGVVRPRRCRHRGDRLDRDDRAAESQVSIHDGWIDRLTEGFSTDIDTGRGIRRVALTATPDEEGAGRMIRISAEPPPPPNRHDSPAIDFADPERNWTANPSPPHADQQGALSASRIAACRDSHGRPRRRFGALDISSGCPTVSADPLTPSMTSAGPGFPDTGHRNRDRSCHFRASSSGHHRSGTADGGRALPCVSPGK